MASALESPQFGSATNRWSGLLQDSNWEIIQAAVHRYRRPSIVFVGWFNYGFHRRFCTHNFCSADNFNRVSTCRFPGSRTFSPQSCCGDRDRCQVRTVNFQEAGTFSLDPGAIQYVALINFNFFRISLGFPEENLSGEWKFFFLRRAEVRGKEIYVSFVSSGILFRISFRNWSTGANLACHLRRLQPASLSGIFL